jgi:hypothetical protein
MLAQTVVCPSCHAELRLKSPPPAELAAAGLTAPCPKCGATVPLIPIPHPVTPHPTHPGSDTDASGGG